MSTKPDTASELSRKKPPEFFEDVRSRASARWSQLESDQDLAGPWRQLFRQVQSPRHVLSELLQNADDAGAKFARACINDGYFVFEHDGEDFNEDQFASLCRFGFSNKRKLHTIGFRGVGFKSTFSLGDMVEVLSPSLAVCFHKRRFTEPTWIDAIQQGLLTRIAVRIQDQNREKELRKNLAEWVDSPASLLFFNSITNVTIGDVNLQREVIGPGPVAFSERIRLTAHGTHDLLMFRSPEEPFPEEAVREIQQERDTEDLSLPPCRVELVVGLPGEHRLYVVLPTGVIVRMPFSCNAPFLQDPARAAIKTPSVSPTNSWLLRRLGMLAGNAMLTWLSNSFLEVNARTQAFCLLPDKQTEGDSLEADTSWSISQGFAEMVGDKPLLLTTEGLLVRFNECVAPPRKIYAVWNPQQLLKVFGDGQVHVLSEFVTEEHRRRLRSWSWLKSLDDDDLIRRLESGRQTPRPAENKNLLALWSLVQQTVGYDYGAHRRRRMAIVPVEDVDTLFPANNVVRLSTKKETISDESWAFLVGLVQVIDRRWIQLLEAKGDDKAIQTARQLLSDLNLDRPSDVNAVVTNACRRLFSLPDVPLEDCVRIAHLMAALDARTPEEFRCVTSDGNKRRPRDGVIGMQDAAMGELLPADWAAAHLLHDAYFRGYSACTRQQWEDWLRSDKSGFYPFVQLDRKLVFNSYDLRSKVREFVRSRGGSESVHFYAQVQQVEVADFGFPDELKKSWDATAREDETLWAKVAERILASPAWYWKDCLQASFQESNYSHTRWLCSSVSAEWIVFFSAMRCLRDMQGRVCVPAELYLRTPETEPLMGVEPFVRAELDTEATKPLLRLLGVRDTPAGLEKLLNRIRALAGAPNPLPLLHEITKWYGALDRVLARCGSSDLEKARAAFRGERLILTGAGEWATCAEVYQRACEDDLPDAPVVHPSVQDFSMWARLGVADRPSAELVLDWLSNLESGKVLEPGIVRRVRTILQRFPTQVWDQCRHWLALDNAWMPVTRLRFRLTMRGLTKWGDLFPVIKAETANLQMLSAEACDRQPFLSLPDLGASIEYRLTQPPEEPCYPEKRPWLATLARRLLRIKLADEAETMRIRSAAARMEQAVWQPFKTIGVTPYIDGTPAGQAHSPDVLWYEKTIFVRDGRLARMFESLVVEVARPFANEAVTEAVKACIERDEGFIAEYMEEHFTLESEFLQPPGPELNAAEKPRIQSIPPAPPVQVLEPTSTDGEVPVSGESNGSISDSLATKPGQEKTEHSIGVSDLIERFATDQGFRWDAKAQRYRHSSGSWLEKVTGCFNWELHDSSGNVVMRFWVSAQKLSSGSVEIGADLWDLIKSDPKSAAIIIKMDNDHPLELTGSDLLKLQSEGKIVLYPATYRLRWETQHAASSAGTNDET